jgi:hypothetical protein
MPLFSFRAFRENFNEDDEKGSHMPRLSYENCKRIFPPHPMTPIFILRLPYGDHFHYAPSPTEFIFISCILQLRL